MKSNATVLPKVPESDIEEDTSATVSQTSLVEPSMMFLLLLVLLHQTLQLWCHYHPQLFIASSIRVPPVANCGNCNGYVEYTSYIRVENTSESLTSTLTGNGVHWLVNYMYVVVYSTVDCLAVEQT